MQLKTIYEAIEKVAPFRLSAECCERYGGYDNSGILVNCGGEIERVLFSLDLSGEAVAQAKALGAQLIVTHHPAIYAPLHALSAEGEGREVLACARAGISVISAHLNLDCAEGGIDASLMHGLGGTRALSVMQPLSCGGYGRVFDVPRRPLSRFVQEIEREFVTQRVLSYGGRDVKRVACFCGAGTEEKSIGFALEHGADTFVSSDPKHHLIARALEAGLNAVFLTHYAAERYGFARFYETIKQIIGSGVDTALFTDERFL